MFKVDVYLYGVCCVLNKPEIIDYDGEHQIVRCLSCNGSSILVMYLDNFHHFSGLSAVW